MPIGADVVSGMLDLFKDVMSVSKTSKEQIGQAAKVYDFEDIQKLQASPEAGKTHPTPSWITETLAEKPKAEATPVKPSEVKAPYMQPPSWIDEQMAKAEAKQKAEAKKVSVAPIKTDPKTAYQTNLSLQQFTNIYGLPNEKYLTDAYKTAYNTVAAKEGKLTLAGAPVPTPKVSLGASTPGAGLGPEPAPTPTPKKSYTAKDPLMDVDPALAMDPKIRMGRAEQLGYTTPAFRGGSRPPHQMLKVDPSYGYYSTASPELANMYTHFHEGAERNIMPLLLNTQNYLTVDAKGKMWSQVNDLAIKQAQKEGKGGIVVKNVYDEPQSTKKLPPQTVYITLDPATARSPQAAFDPAKTSINNLLGANRAVPIPPGMLEAIEAGQDVKPEHRGPSMLRAINSAFAPLKQTLMHPIATTQQDIQTIKDMAVEAYKTARRAVEGFGQITRGELEVKPEKPGMLSEEDVERARMAREQETHIAGDIAQTLMMGGAGSLLVGAERKGAAGIFGGFLSKAGNAQKTNTVLVPSKQLITATSDDLNRMRKWVQADRIEVSQHIDAFPPEFKTAKVQQEFYEKLEDSKKTLTPDKEAFFAQKILPMRLEIQKLQQVAHKYSVPLTDNEWVHRIIGGTSHDSPQYGTHGLPKRTSSMMARSLYSIERQTDGKRITVSSPAPGKLTIWNKGNPTTVKWGDKLEVGTPLTIQGQLWSVKHARTAELEADTPYWYHKSAGANLGDALVKMRGVVRNVEYLDRVTKTPDWLQWATRGDAPRGWKETEIPQLRGWKVHPKLAGPFDDFYKAGFKDDSLDTVRRINRFAVGSLFWNPIPHVENVMGHWFVGRGWDWVKPSGYHSLFSDGARAIKSTMTLDKDYQNLLKHGASLISGGIHNGEFYQAIGKKLGLEFQHSGMLGQLEKAIGMKIPNPIGWWYRAMNKVLWQAGDVFMLQRVFELERKGLSRLDAIREAEKHIPNYRIPSEVLKSRAFSKFMQDPLITAFGRYHYGIWNSYTNMVRDLLGPNATRKQRLEASGNVAMLFALTYGIYPAVSWGLQKLTGEGDIQKLPRGPAAIPSIISSATLPEQKPDWMPDSMYTNWYENLRPGERSFFEVIGNSITLAPPIKEVIEQTGGPEGHDLFTGQPIAQPGEDDPWIRGAQRVDHALGSMAAPLRQIQDVRNTIGEKGVPREVLKQVVGTHDPTEEQLIGKARAQQRQRKAAMRRRGKPRGIIEEGAGYFSE